MVFENLLHPVLGPLLNLPSLYAILILSFSISLLITIIYKFTTNQSLMKDLKDEMKEFQKEMKELRQNPEEMMKVQKKAMQTNMKYMSHSMKSTLYTFIPIIIIFGWMSAHLAFEPINPGEDFTVSVFLEDGVSGEISLEVVPEGLNIEGSNMKEIKDSEIKWVLNGNAGDYLLEFTLNDANKYNTDVLVTDNHEYKQPIKKVGDGSVDRIEIEHNKNIVLNLFGWKLGWLGTYIIFSIVFSMVLRRMLKIY